MGDVGTGPPKYFKGKRPTVLPEVKVIGEAACFEQGERLPLPIVARTIYEGMDSRCFKDPVYPCSNCTGPSHVKYVLTCGPVVDGAFGVSALEGTYDLNQLAPGAPCMWRSGVIVGADGTYRWQITVSAGGLLRIGFTRTTPTFRVIGTVNPWNCDDDLDAPVDGGGFGTFPPTVRISW